MHTVIPAQVKQPRRLYEVPWNQRFIHKRLK